jgi:hypothetical protein
MKLAGSENEIDIRRYTAWLDIDSSAPSPRCYVEGISRSGAKLTVFNSPVPDEFTLHFNRTGDAKVRCRVTSRVGTNCSVEFMASLSIYG